MNSAHQIKKLLGVEIEWIPDLALQFAAEQRDYDPFFTSQENITSGIIEWNELESEIRSPRQNGPDFQQLAFKGLNKGCSMIVYLRQEHVVFDVVHDSSISPETALLSKIFIINLLNSLTIKIVDKI